ncbi:uncharacterized protein F5147DRAFT_727407 [Suillus discolor]|uniref:DUF2470 domain-containing protein n=1 Tax=Suillus discolor TaxID=1912936 RepID=A0A9P7JLN7_9AGAM|nr:uncharacterized protein F5147DRAFT_727407 [Suillus discolor]KAG2087919.1 hypothetical protein F5147DRAFT_727407 [Suillus discolor]
MSDPVASKSGFLCMYMKNHPDTLVAYVKYFGKVEGNVLTAEMSSIDSKDMTLVYKLKSGQSNTSRVSFDPPLSGYEEVKPRLLSMKAEAQEGLGMLKAPQITTFRIPRTSVFTGILLFAYFYFLSPPAPDTTFLSVPVTTVNAFFSPAHAFRNATGLGLSFRTACAIFCTIHGAETFYTWSLCRQYVKGAIVTAAYVGSTMMLGYPIWSDLKRRVQQKRIESVMKAE